MAQPPSNPDQFEEAVQWFRQRVPVDEATFKAMSARAKRKAWTVSGVAQMDMVQDVFNGIDKALKEGTDFKQWKKEFGPKLAAAWGHKDAARVETIWRTNVLMAHNAGRFRQQTHPAVLEARPYWKLVTAQDARTSPICRELKGVILRADDPWWESHYPPLHHRCRTIVTALSKEQAQSQGITGDESDALGVPAAKGFGLTPTENEWEPSPDSYADQLWKEYERKRKEGQPPAPPKEPKPERKPRKPRQPKPVPPPSPAPAPPAKPRPQTTMIERPAQYVSEAAENFFARIETMGTTEDVANELENYLINSGATPNPMFEVDFQSRRMTKDAAIGVARAAARIQDDFGSMFNTMSTMVSSTTADVGEAIADANFSASRVRFNSKYFSVKPGLDRDFVPNRTLATVVKEMVERNWFSKGLTDVTEIQAAEYIAIHEFGHILEFNLRNRSVSHENDVEAFHRRVSALDKTSTYGLTNKHEAWAEGIAAIYFQPESEWNDYTRELAKFLQPFMRSTKMVVR